MWILGWKILRYSQQLCDVYSFIYRTDIFEEKGLNIPTTWEDVNDVAAKLTTEDMYGMSLAGLGEQVGQFWRARYIWD